jgi:hypothetical protein
MAAPLVTDVAATQPASRGLARLSGIRKKQKHLPADSPVARQVFLLDQKSHIVVRATWSDATTGAYAFSGLNTDIAYAVVAYDYLHNYRAVIADHLTAEVPT